jgi:UDP-N-acetylmuramate--alanine ligase
VALTAPRVSPMAQATQVVGITAVTVTYGRPAVKERQIWGELVPWGEVWRTGANEATQITFSHDAKVEGKPLSAGTYALFALPEKGILIYNKDNPGAAGVAHEAKKYRQDIRFIPYGKSAEGRFRITDIGLSSGTVRFSLAGIPGDFSLSVPGEHTVSNAAAATALSVLLLEKENGILTESDIAGIRRGLKIFRGSKRRSEIIGEAGGILFLDDYAHHPTAIHTTLKGYREFFPGKRIVVDFMSHTYSRTKELLPEFGVSFSSADEVILHKIYASAREKNDKSITGKDLYQEVAKHHRDVHYIHNLEEAIPFLKGILRPGDLFVTMGAGDNWKIGSTLFDMLQTD